jgi:hypothetical protein
MVVILSTPSLGITRNNSDLFAVIKYGRTFNSLSRDHSVDGYEKEYVEQIMLSTPSLGIT